MKEITTGILWMYACNHQLEKLKKYYENGGEKNRRFIKFGKEHSLIMGAYRTQDYEIVEYLLSVGETITPEEEKEINEKLQEIEWLIKIKNMMGDK